MLTKTKCAMKNLLFSSCFLLLSIASSPGQIKQFPPLDDITERELVSDHRVLPYPPTQERDIFWEKRIWQIIDTRTLKNLPFRYPEKPFFTVLTEEIKKGNITPYSADDDKFSRVLTPEEFNQILSTTDTVPIFDPETYEQHLQIVRNDINPEDIYLYRIKEIWWVDSRYSQLKVRILGIAPIKAVFDDQGNFRYYKPLFWIYYPEARHALARHRVFNPWNDASTLSWEDWIEMRFFDSWIIKESNVHDRRIEDYASGIEALREGQRIKDEIFNFEQDLWSY